MDILLIIGQNINIGNILTVPIISRKQSKNGY